MMTAVLLVLAAAPLEVRVLERETPASVRLEAERISCDGKPVEKNVEVIAGPRELKVGAALCQLVAAEGGVTVTARSVTRKFAGSIRASLQGSVVKLVNVVAVDDYLPSVLQVEADGMKPAALEAQAIVSRTFALTAHRHGSQGYDLCDLAHCQVYRGTEASPASITAVKNTANQVLLIGGIVLKPAFFHSSCGGHTSSANDVFGEDAAGSAVSDVENGEPRCKTNDFEWTFEATQEDFAKAFNVRAVGAALEPLRKDKAGRIIELRVFGKRMSGQSFLSQAGRTFGWQAVRSAKFTARSTDNAVVLKGTGLGHGVGLCQLGAKALAERGVDAKGILSRYFPESQVKPAP
ncbi:MAG: SpoIID/LytB domain-containing protein [Archangium sp.]